jgi:hypothetical protein
MKRFSILVLILLTCFVAAGWPQAAVLAKHTISTFDPPGPPGPGPGPYQGTQALGITPVGAITGFYSDSINVYHAFLRNPDGTFVEFDAPDAGTQSVAGFVPTPLGVLGGQGTYAVAINKAGTITGLYVDIANTLHGFLRAPDGTITKIEVPGAGTGLGQGTIPGNISPNGTIFGTYIDASNVTHAFLLTPKGVLTTFDVPGAGTAAGQGTFSGWASCINPAGAVTGWFIDASNVIHGYIRDSHGVITPFDAPGAGTAAFQGTYAWSINQNGLVTAAFSDPLGMLHGYLRYADGSFRIFDAPGAIKNPGQGTMPEGISPAGVIFGNFIDPDGVNYGFRRAWNGKITRFRVDAAGTGTGQGTVPLTVNSAGQAVGSYFDSNFVIHGFLITW